MSQINKISNQIDIYSLESVLCKSLWALDSLATEDKDRFSSPEIAHYLVESKGVNVSRQAIQSTLVKCPNYCNYNKKSGFKIMKQGQDMLSESLQENKVLFIESGKPYSAKNIFLKDLLSKAVGTLLVCDPYVDLNTLDLLFKNVNKKTPIMILTSKIIDKPSGVMVRHLSELKSEGYKIEIRIYSSSELHDRYFIDDKSFWLSGNSLNFLGNKESFIVQLGEDIRRTMLATFNGRWKAAVSV